MNRETVVSEVYNCNCMDFMRSIPDKHFDLAVVDPPYGINADKENLIRTQTRNGRAKAKNKVYRGCLFDAKPPDKDYFQELFRVSKDQIIFGGNYYIQHLKPTNCMIVWDKETGNNSYADCELAWTSFRTTTRLFKFKWHGMLQGDMKNKEVRIHPTQKPVALYAWIFRNYAKPGYKILDTHLGSGSSRIAAYKLGLDFYATELDKDYFDKQEERFRKECLGEFKIASGKTIIEQTLF